MFLGHIRGLKTVVGWLATLILQLHNRHPFHYVLTWENATKDYYSSGPPFQSNSMQNDNGFKLFVPRGAHNTGCTCSCCCTKGVLFRGSSAHAQSSTQLRYPA